MSRVSGHEPVACADRALLLEDDLGIDSLALAKLIEVLSAQAGIVTLDEETGRARTAGGSQDIPGAYAPGTGTT